MKVESQRFSNKSLTLSDSKLVMSILGSYHNEPFW